jgi:hypothetical protein
MQHAIIASPNLPEISDEFMQQALPTTREYTVVLLKKGPAYAPPKTDAWSASGSSPTCGASISNWCRRRPRVPPRSPPSRTSPGRSRHADSQTQLGFNPTAYRVLLRTNWVRTMAWSVLGVLDLWLLWESATLV